MPPVKVSRSQTNGGAPVGDVTPEEAAQIRSSVAAKEQAPSSRVQSVFSNWRDVADQLGDPFETEKIPISKLRQMRRDPMLGFGLNFIKTPHVSAKWYMNAKDNNGPNAQISAHADHDFRRIYASYVLQYMNSLDFGFQAVSKRFEFRTPSGTFINIDQAGGTPTEQPIWSQGGIQPIAWKPFVPLRPEGVNPVWDNGTGEFAGIEYIPTAGEGSAGGAGGGAGASQTSGGSGGTNKEQAFKIDLPHSLWITHEKESNFGSIFGYPRLGYAYKYWWSYWFRWAIADRAFERKADPSVLVYHPDGEFVNEDTGERLSHAEYALLMGDRMRSGGVIALPSETYEDANGRGTIRQWEIDFTKDAVNFDPFDKSFDYLDVQKLRALFIPEQAFLEGKGGTSSRNVADTLGSAFITSQKVLNAQIVENINRFILPQWLAVNYPEFVANNGSVEIVVQGFSDEDTAFMIQLVQLIGQQEVGSREIAKLVDLQKLLENRGTPIASFADQQRREAEAVAAAAAAAPPSVAPVPGANVGVIPAAPGTGGSTAAGATGFSYIQPRELIYLSESGNDFLDNLPNSPHYEDKAIKGFSRQLWTLYRNLYRDEYATAIEAMQEDGDVQASDDDLSLSAMSRAKKILEKWQGSQKWTDVLDRSKTIMSGIMKRASRIELSRVKSKTPSPTDQMEAWLDEHLAEVAGKIAETTRNELESFAARQIEAGIADRVRIAQLAREHFDSFPDWKADRLVRTEVRDIYNAATLFAAQAGGFERVQALDAQGSAETDPECVDRDGKIFPIKDAFKEKEHPNGTLGWRAVPVELSIERRNIEEGALWEAEENLLTLSDDIDDQTERKILKSVVDSLVS